MTFSFICIASIEYSAVSQQLKRFAERHQQSLGMECCSIFLSVQDLMANLVLPPEVGNPVVPSLPPGGPPGSVGGPSPMQPVMGNFFDYIFSEID